MTDLRIELAGIKLVISRTKLVVPVPWGHFTAFFAEQRDGRYTPHFTFHGSKPRRFFEMRSSRIKEVHERCQRRLLKHWLSAAQYVTLDQLAGEGWIGIDIPDSAFDTLLSRFLKTRVIELTEETFVRASEWLLDHAIVLEQLPHDDRAKSIYRVMDDDSFEFRHLFPMPGGRWVILPTDWLSDEQFVQIMREEVPPAFWKGVRHILQLFRVKDLSRVDQFVRGDEN